MGAVAAHGRRVRRVLLLWLIDLAVAALLAILVFRLFGAYSGNDTNPPVCSNASGDVVSCSLAREALLLPTFLIALLGLITWQVFAGRTRNPPATS